MVKRCEASTSRGLPRRDFPRLGPVWVWLADRMQRASQMHYTLRELLCWASVKLRDGVAGERFLLGAAQVVGCINCCLCGETTR